MMQIDKSLFLHAFAQIKMTPSFEVLLTTTGLKLDFLDQKIALCTDFFDVSEILPPFDLDADQFYLWSLKTVIVGKLALKAALNYVPEEKIIEGNHEFSSNDVHIIFANLHIKGTLKNKGKTVIFGNVRVDGKWIETYSDYAHCAIIGDLFINDSILTEGSLSISGKLETQLAYMSFNQGTTIVMNGCSVKVLIESDHGNSLILNKIKVDFTAFDELTVEFDIEDSRLELLENSASIFCKTFASDIDQLENDEDDEWKLWSNFEHLLYEYLEKDKQIF
jgi:coenzyme F420-reducing hydrogenase delta subunit